MQLPREFSLFIEKKVVFCLVVGGVTPLPPLSGPTTKKNIFFYVCLPLLLGVFKNLRVPDWSFAYFKFAHRSLKVRLSRSDRGGRTFAHQNFAQGPQNSQKLQEAGKKKTQICKKKTLPLWEAKKGKQQQPKKENIFILFFLFLKHIFSTIDHFIKPYQDPMHL